MKWGILLTTLLIGLVIFLLNGGESDKSDLSDEPMENVVKEKSQDPDFFDDGQEEEVKSEDLKKITPKVTNAPQETLSKLDGNETPNNVPLTEDEMEELEEYFEKIEEEWGETLVQLFKNELQLSRETIEQYEELREGFEEEKLTAFQEYHESMVAKHGENYAYRPSEDEKVFEQKVLDEYYDRLRRILGEEDYSRYTEVRERFNERIKAEQDPSKGILVIDF